MFRRFREQRRFARELEQAVAGAAGPLADAASGMEADLTDVTEAFDSYALTAPRCFMPGHATMGLASHFDVADRRWVYEWRCRSCRHAKPLTAAQRTYFAGHRP